MIDPDSHGRIVLKQVFQISFGGLTEPNRRTKKSSGRLYGQYNALFVSAMTGIFLIKSVIGKSRCRLLFRESRLESRQARRLP
jgi:hypothetical protein